MPRPPRAAKTRAIKAIKKMYRKKSRGYKTLVNLNSLAPIAQRYITKMKYAEVVTTSLGGGTYAITRWNLNSIFDPNQGGIGTQPYGFDQLSPLYNRYRVIGCKYNIYCTSSDGSPLQIAAVATNETISPGSISEVRSNPRAKYIMQGTGASLRKLSGNVYIPSLVGRTKAQYMADDRYQAVVTGSPNELALLTVFAGPVGEGSSLISVTYNVQLEYLVEFFDIKHQNAS